jgi:hypothetical protein
VIDRDAEALKAVGVVESVACTVKLDVPAEVGFPEMIPVVGSRVTPPGRLPLAIDHE